MLIACAPWLVASRIAAITLPSVRSLFSISSLQSYPAPAMPMPLSAAAQARPATCVPCPMRSTVAEPSSGSPSRSLVYSICPARSAWVPSTPESITATLAPTPCVTLHACGNPSRSAHHSIGVPGGVLGAVSGALSAGSLGSSKGVARSEEWRRARMAEGSARAPDVAQLGASRYTKRRSTATALTPGCARNRRSSSARLTPAAGRTVSI
jgi:hypothetical protein